MNRLLLVGNDESLHNKFSENLSYPVKKTTSGTGSISILKNERIDCILIDLSITDIKPCDLIERMRKNISGNTPIIVLSDSITPKQVDLYIRKGATGFILKKYRGNELTLDPLFELNLGRLQKPEKFKATSDDDTCVKFIYSHKRMRRLHYEMKKCSNFATTVLLVGETGVGKDCAAREIHALSARRNKPFVVVPVNSIAESLIESELFGHEKGAFSGAQRKKIGKFEAAHGGTIYIPEISDLPDIVQLKLLNFIQYRTVTQVGQDPLTPHKYLDVLLIFSTNVDLELLVRRQRIREDFYHRINVVKLTIPPLRDRKEDIIPLADYFSRKYSYKFFQKEIKMGQDVIKALQRYDWPGNVRELENVIERSLIYAVDKYSQDGIPDVLGVEYFSEFINKQLHSNMIYNDNNSEIPRSYKAAEQQFRKEYFRRLLEKTDGSVSRAASIANMTPQGLRKILKKLGINPKLTVSMSLWVSGIEKHLFPVFEWASKFL